MDRLISFFENASSLKMNLESNAVLIYGAGNSGKGIASYLIKQGVNVLAFIDQHKPSGSTLLDCPIYTLDQAFLKFGKDIPVLISIHNRAVDLDELTKLIRSSGFEQIFNMFNYVSQFPSDNAYRFFLANPITLKSEKDNAAKFFSYLADERSKNLFLDFVKFRLSGNYSFCPKPEFNFQYAPKDIPTWSNPLRLIDCGAYNGDSIRSFQEYGYDLESVIALEPDDENYLQLCENSKNIPGIFLPCGASSKSQTMQFNSGDGEASRAIESGGQSVQMLSIDDAFPDWAPNLIKMDVEGGEMAALVGAQKTISTYRPGLALSAYHLPTDLWRLGLFIQSMDLGYQFYLRPHGYSSFDTVLYAVAQ